MPENLQLINPVGTIGEFYQVNSFFGWRKHPVTGELSYHKGIDIPAPKGTIIRSSLPGLVVLSSFSQSAGNYIIIEHHGGYKTKYMHLSSRLVDKGQVVKEGDPIGIIGATGRVTGVHLHFELHKDGEPIDPLDYYNNSTRNNPYAPDKINFLPWLIGGTVLTSLFIIYKNQRKN